MALDTKVVFLLHGIGTYEPTWADDATKILSDNWDAILTLKARGPAKEAFKVIPLTYDNVFEDIRTRWKQDFEDFQTGLGDFNPNSNAINTLNSIYKVGTRDSFVDTHVFDLLLYYLVPAVRERVCSSVFLQMRNALLAEGIPSGWSLIAHSMGTSVAHDVLQGAVTHQWGALGGAFPDGVIRVNFLAMLANCSELLERKCPIFNLPGFNPWDTYSSRVWPGLSNDALADYYLSVVHKLDPVTMPDPFSPTAHWPGRDGANPARGMPSFIEVGLKVVTDPNVHSLKHYISDPSCYIPIFRLIGSKDWVDAATEKKLVAAYETKGILQAEVDSLRQRLVTAAIGKVDLAENSSQFGTWAKKLVGFLQ